MDEGKNMVCRLCLKMPFGELVLIDEAARQMLDGLVKMNFDLSDNPMMCKDCMEIVKRSLSFKSMCMNSEEPVLLCDSDDICRFCIKKVEESKFTSLNVLMKENTFSDMVKEYMFQMDLNLTKSPIICLQCQENMESYFKFLRNCRDTEEKINMYYKGIRIGEKINLINVFETFFKYTKVEETCNSIMEIKEELDTMEEELMDSKFLHQDGKISDHMACTCDTKDGSCFGCRAVDIKVETVLSEECKQPLKSETEDLVTKDDVTSSRITDERGTAWDVSEACIYQCVSCEFRTKHKHSIKNHLLTHKRSLKNHLPNHNDFSDVQIYQCDSCEFQTKYKSSLKNHLLIHKDSSDVQIYHCDNCEFQTKHKFSLKTHLLTHKDFSDVRAYQCDYCEFQTKYKGSLQKHLLTHKDSSVVQIYQCDSCDFQTRHRANLKTHVLNHKDFSDVQMYQCDSCEFQTKYKRYLKDHLLTHKDFSDAQIFQCDSCEFQTKYKKNLKRHLLAHKDSSDVQMYQCGSCEFQTKHKRSLTRHFLLTHKESSDVQMYQCDSCEFRSKYKRSVNRHLLTHKD